MNLTEISEKIFKGRTTKTPIASIVKDYPEFSIKEAYEIQTHNFEGSRESLSGYKMGLTTKAKQRDVGVFEPIRGILSKEREIVISEVNIRSLMQPRVEPEIAIILDRDFNGKNVSIRQIESSISFVGLAFEVLDSVFENYQFKIQDVISDNCSFAHYSIGNVNLKEHMKDLPLMGILLKKNGKLMETGVPASVLGHPLRSVQALIHGLADVNRIFKAGEVCLTGGMTKSISVQSGDRVELSSTFDSMFLQFK